MPQTIDWVYLTTILLGVSLAACGKHAAHTEIVQPTFSRTELLSPETCGSCHPSQYSEWQASMHAQAATDPLFVAMQARAQRDSNSQLQTFCVNCHAPMAVHDHQTVDGANIGSLPTAYQGVTCYFCHNVNQVNGSHNNPLILADDTKMRGPLSNPLSNDAHGSVYSNLHDGTQLTSSSMCGSCHDIQMPQGFLVERSYQEWQHSVFASHVGGNTCNQCHMLASATPLAIADVPNAPLRPAHSHLFPAVDLPLDANAPGRAQLSQAVQSALSNTLQQGLCVLPAGNQAQIRVLLDNVASGHLWPSGASSDRRAFVEVIATVQNQVIYQSGVLNANNSDLTAIQNDPDLWVLRDCVFDNNSVQVPFFWQANDDESNTLPTLTTFNQNDPGFYQTHVKQNYPRSPAAFLSQVPDKVTLRVRLQAIGTDLLNNLVNSQDLDANLLSLVPTYDVTATLTWTLAAAQASFNENGLVAYCVSDGAFNLQAQTMPATNHSRCNP